MQAPSIPENEEQRLCALVSLDLLATPAEVDFDRVTRTAAAYFRVPIALVTLVDRERQWFKSRIGLDVPETRREISFCGHAILQDGVFIVPDARADDRFADNPLVTGDLRVRFYAGAPVRAPNGLPLGSLCVIDRVPRQLDERQRRALRDLRDILQNEILQRSRIFRDHLTQLFNRRFLDDHLGRETRRAYRTDTVLATIMIDVDHFKRINDTFGHAVGDLALCQLSRILREHIGTGDVLARLGGEEFVVVMLGVTREAANAMAEKLRHAVESLSLLPSGDHFTISLGLCWLEPRATPLSEAEILRISDEALYEAKRLGRNRVVVGL